MGLHKISLGWRLQSRAGKLCFLSFESRGCYIAMHRFRASSNQTDYPFGNLPPSGVYVICLKSLQLFSIWYVMVKLFSNYLTVSPLYLGLHLWPPHMVHQFVLKISVRRSSQFLPCQNSCEGLHYVDSEKSSQHLSKESRREENLTVFLMSMCPSLSTSTQNMEFY